MNKFVKLGMVDGVEKRKRTDGGRASGGIRALSSGHVTSPDQP
jgi:hypothetical protein